MWIYHLVSISMLVLSIIVSILLVNKGYNYYKLCLKESAITLQEANDILNDAKKHLKQVHYTAPRIVIKDANAS